MSGNTQIKRVPIPVRADRRIMRTRDTLGDALVELMRETPFGEITVQQVLDRAGVGRTTFYAHYCDKEDLFLSDVEDFLEATGTLLTRRGAPLNRIAPVEELLTHLAEMRDFHDAINASGKATDVRELAIGCFARSIEKRLTLAGVALPLTDLRARSHALGGALFSLLEWWIRHNQPMPPKDMDTLFHRLVWDGFSSPEATKT